MSRRTKKRIDINNLGRARKTYRRPRPRRKTKRKSYKKRKSLRMRGGKQIKCSFCDGHGIMWLDDSDNKLCDPCGGKGFCRDKRCVSK